MVNYSIHDNILTIKSDFEENLNDVIKNVIITNGIENILFYSRKYELLNELNFYGSNIKSIVISSLCREIFIINNNNQNYKIIKLDNLPKTLESLEIASNCVELGLDQQMFQNLPPRLKKLKLYSCDDISFENLPNTLEVLDISCLSNHANLLDYLPASLKSLNIRITQIFKSAMNQNPNINNLSNYIEIGFDSLPSGLESLKIISQYYGELNCLPVDLKVLYLPGGYVNEIKNIPKNLEELKIPIKYEHLDNFKVCAGLKKIIIGFTNKSHSHNISNFDLEKIPKSIDEIEFGDDFNQVLENLPMGLRKITFGFNFKPYSIDLVDSIEYLEFGYNFNGTIKKYPSNLKYLKFGRNFNQEINNLPKGLINLSINERFHSNISNLPSTLLILEFDLLAELNKDILCIPDSTHTIILGKYMGKNKINIPKNLKNITYSETNTWITQELENIGFEGTITTIKNETY